MFTNFIVGTPAELGDDPSIEGVDLSSLDDSTQYILHIYDDRIDAFEILETGTPLNFIEASDDQDVLRTTRSEDQDVLRTTRSEDQDVLRTTRSEDQDVLQTTRSEDQDVLQTDRFEDLEEDIDPETNDPTSYVLPALYGTDKKGKERIWKTWSVKAVVHKIYGETKGIRTPSQRVFKGLNIGKKNATTAIEQAKREAERDWIKQLEKGYHPKSAEGLELEKKIVIAKKKQGGVNVNLDKLFRGVDEPETDNKQEDVDDGDSIVITPMKCHTWVWEPKCLKYFDFDNGVYIQPKLDGIRCIARISNGKILLTTKTNKSMVHLNHLREELKIFLSKEPDIILDGEVYAHTMTGEDGLELDDDARFNVISGGARPKRNTPHPLEGQLCLYVFDIADPTGELDQDARFDILKRLFKSPLAKKCPHVKRVDTRVVYDQEEIDEYHGEVAEKRYEGVVIRARDLVYKSKQSLRMRKYKNFKEDEFTIIDAECDEGVDTEFFKWICETLVESPDGEITAKIFKAKPKGTRAQRQEWFANADDYIGQMLNVKYQDLSPDGIPRFPIGQYIRDAE